MSEFIITGFSDEIDSAVSAQFEHLKKLGISYFEPRTVDGKNISKLTDEEVADLKEKMAEYGIKASSIGSPIGKIKITDPFDEHLESLKHTIKIAKALGTKYIRVFSFFIPEDEHEKYRDEVMRRLKAMVALAEEEGVVLLHENEKDIYGDIACRCAEIFEEISSPNLRGVFDPANFVQCGQDTDEGYELLKDYIDYMHIKDALADGTVVPSGKGDGNVEKILRRLKDRGYTGFLSLEPHLGSFEGLQELEISNDMMQLSKSTAGKFTIAYDALKKIIETL